MLAQPVAGHEEPSNPRAARARPQTLSLAGAHGASSTLPVGHGPEQGAHTRSAAALQGAASNEPRAQGPREQRPHS